MFGISSAEFAVILVIALLVVGPKQLPEVLRTFGRVYRKLNHFVRKASQVVDDIMYDADKIAENDKIYAGYIQRNEREIAAYRRDAELKIPAHFEYKNLPGLTNELVEKLTATRPENIADLSRIPGMTPAGIMVVMRKIKCGN